MGGGMQSKGSHMTPDHSDCFRDGHGTQAGSMRTLGLVSKLLGKRDSLSADVCSHWRLPKNDIHPEKKMGQIKCSKSCLEHLHPPMPEGTTSSLKFSLL